MTPAELPYPVIYAKVDNFKFDEKYYKDTHMPLVAKKWVVGCAICQLCQADMFFAGSALMVRMRTL